ncbi:MAG: DegV family protein [Anaerolineae bacterium]
MSQVAVVTDSTASLPLPLYDQFAIGMVPYYLHYGGRVLRDMVDIGPDEFCRYLAELPESAELPQTANPGPGDYMAAFTAAAGRARSVLSFHMTSVGSGAYQAALIGREMALQRLRGVQIEIIDTRNVSMCHGWIALQAARAALAGQGLTEIFALVQKLLPVARMFQTADTLRYLYMGGRIGRAKHLVGALLSIRPIVSMEDGEIVAAGVSRSRQGAYRKMLSQMQLATGVKSRLRVALTHAAAQAEAESLGRLVSSVYSPVEVLCCDLSPALAVHSGLGTVGLCYVVDPE